MSNSIDKVINAVSWIGVVGIWLMAALSYENLPDQIPIHYDSSGKPDQFGDKDLIWGLPIVSTLLLVIITLLNMYSPKLGIKPKKRQTRLLIYLKLIVIIIFAFIAFETIKVSYRL